MKIPGRLSTERRPGVFLFVVAVAAAALAFAVAYAAMFGYDKLMQLVEQAGGTK